MRYPDFFIIGAMKCGTTTLASQLSQQSGIFMSDPKEPNFFSDPVAYAKKRDWYFALFDQASDGQICGEASTHYTKLPDWPDTTIRIKNDVENPKFIYVIRNPVDRLVSHYVHEWSDNTISCSLRDAIQLHPRLVEYGLYGYQIAPFVDLFGVENVLLTSLEAILFDQRAELKKIASHIGCSDEIIWDASISRLNVSGDRVRRLPFHEVLVDSSFLRFVRRKFVPKSVRSWIREKRKIGTRPTIPPDQMSDLIERFQRDKVQLMDYFPENSAIRLSYSGLD